jgi:NADP-dependent 3-hydroxy acid dehydrogenase YdfG
MPASTPHPIVVITGAGAIGVAAARRMGSGKSVVLADCNTPCLESAVSYLEQQGYNAKPFEVDISRHELVAKLASYATRSN